MSKESGTKTDIEALMRPRYKVIADHPNMSDAYKVGDIIESPGLFSPDFSKYPHLFKPLAWYEDREASEMPAFLKIEGGRVSKVKEWTKDRAIFDNGESWMVTPNVFDFFEPATEAEYQEYINNQNKK